MNQLKSKIISFRLPRELEELAGRFAIADADKNASAWCQKKIIELLLELDQAERTTLLGKPVEMGTGKTAEDASTIPANGSFAAALSPDEMLAALGNLRQINLRCFEILLRNNSSYREFLETGIVSEEEWAALSNRITAADQVDQNCNSVEADAADFAKRETEAEKGIVEMNSFLEEIKSDIAEIIGEETESGESFSINSRAVNNCQLV